MTSPDLIVNGPHPIADHIESFQCLDPESKESVLLVEKTSLLDNRNVSVSWPADTTLERTITAINQVWSGQENCLFISPVTQENDLRIAGYETEGLLTTRDLLQYHPSGFKWLRVETPLNNRMPDLFVPLGKKPDYAGIILDEPAILEWKHFWPLYQATAANPYNEASVRQALIQTGSLAEIK